MLAEMISVREMQEEILSMLSVCFEGTVSHYGDKLLLTLENGQSFSVHVEDSTGKSLH